MFKILYNINVENLYIYIYNKYLVSVPFLSIFLHKNRYNLPHLVNFIISLKLVFWNSLKLFERKSRTSFKYNLLHISFLLLLKKEGENFHLLKCWYNKF